MVCYSANGNTFLLVDNTEKKISDDEKPVFVRNHAGDLDGVIFVEKVNEEFFMDYYNRDGSTAAFCGNGARAFSQYLIDRGWIKDEEFSFFSRAGEIKVIVEDGVWVRMPRLSEKREMTVNGYNGYFVIVGVPHFVVEVEDVDKINMEKLGRDLRNKTNANVDFYQVIEDALKVRTYERGVERETKACGTGVTAVFVVHKDKSGLNEMKIHVPGGTLFVKEKSGEIFLKGDVRRCSEE